MVLTQDQWDRLKLDAEAQLLVQSNGNEGSYEKKRTFRSPRRGKEG